MLGGQGSCGGTVSDGEAFFFIVRIGHKMEKAINLVSENEIIEHVPCGKLIGEMIAA